MSPKLTSAQRAEDLIDQLEDLAVEAGHLMKEATEETVKKQLGAFKERMQDISYRLKGYYEDVEQAVISGARTTDRTIRNHPYESMAVALAVGVLIGALLRNR
jgi:ElaB/YqjD/DUF883 family membrane-anchored ribosome-binding protein